MKKKKLVLTIVVIVLLVLLSLGVYFMFFYNQKEKINVYLFWGNGCPHCENAKKFFNDIQDEYGKYYHLIEYEVWYNEDNNNLMNKVNDRLEANATGVPFIVIGKDYFKGYSLTMSKNIKETIISQYENDNYIDVVEEVN